MILANNLHTINKIIEAEDIFNAADQDTLVIFDVDCVLTMPSDPILQLTTCDKYKTLYKDMVKDLTRDERYMFNHMLISHSSSQLVEPLFPTIIASLQQRKIKVIAMTAGKTGLIKKHVYFPDWRYAELKRLGIDFSDIFPGKKYFFELVDFAGDFPGIEKGIVYSMGNRNTKGDVLKYLFTALQWTPKKILAIDDKLKNLFSFYEIMNNMVPAIDFIGLHYQGADLIPEADVPEADFVNTITDLLKQIKE